jgi:hypothetical protein
MNRSKTNTEAWDMIFDDLILEANPPPTKYIKDAVIITKNGSRFKVSAEDFTAMVAQQKEIVYENSDIHSCSLNIDFTRIKRDVNRWTNKFIETIEIEAAKMVEEMESQRKKRIRPKTPPKKID